MKSWPRRITFNQNRNEIENWHQDNQADGRDTDIENPFGKVMQRFH